MFTGPKICVALFCNHQRIGKRKMKIQRRVKKLLLAIPLDYTGNVSFQTCPTHIPAQTHAYLHTPEHKRAYQCSPMHTHPVRENRCTPAYTPNIPTHPLN